MEQQEKVFSKEGLRIVVFNNQFVTTSETFIYRQIIALATIFEVELLAFKLVNQKLFDLSAFHFMKLAKKSSVVERAVRFIVNRMTGFRYNYYRSTYLSLNKSVANRDVIIHAHFGWNGIYILPFARKHNIPLVISFHGNDASGQLSKLAYKRALPALFEYASHVIVCSNHMVDTLGLQKHSDKVSVVPYGIDADEFAPVSYTRNNNVIKILHSGRLVSKKGVQDLIRVFADLNQRYSQILLEIVGDGESRDECEKLTLELGVTASVKFFGALPQFSVKEHMNGCDIFVLNSRTDEKGSMEGLPNSILEAMAFEKAVVSTRHAGIPMAIHDRMNGILVAEKDNGALYKALEELITNDELRTELGRGARETIVKTFTNKIMTESIVSIFQSVKSARSNTNVSA